MIKDCADGINKLEDLVFDKEGYTKVFLGTFNPGLYDLQELTQTMDDLCLNKGCVGEILTPYVPLRCQALVPRYSTIDLSSQCASLRLFTISYGKDAPILIKGTVKFNERIDGCLPANIIFRPRILANPNGKPKLICFDLVPE